jgi:alpha-beta hydrolase superfamily lysophospholipase
MIPGSDGYPVNYPAAMGSQGQGTTDILRHLNEKIKACPNTKYALGGHSQGGFAVVDAGPKFTKEMLSRIVAVTMFGSPACPNQIKDRCISYCANGDSVCRALTSVIT